jgi:hypothetical protein
MRLPALISRLLGRCHASRPAVAPARRTAGVHVEELENRQVPSAVPAAEPFVAVLYQGLLGRPADVAGLAYWGGRLSATGSPTAVAAELLQSPEATTRDLQILYQNFLGRPLSQVGLTYWGGVANETLRAFPGQPPGQAVLSGDGFERVKAGVLGSDEFFARAGGTNFDFLNSVYESQLGRPLDEAGRVYWGTQLAAGMSRTGLASQILSSPEAQTVKAAGAYEEILGHSLTAAGASYWVGGLLAGRGDAWLYSGLVGSDEFQAAFNASASVSLADPNAAADQFLTEGQRFDVSLPGVEVLNRHLSGQLTAVVGALPPSVLDPTDAAPPASPAPVVIAPAPDNGSDGSNTPATDDGSGDNPPADSGDNPPPDSGNNVGADPGNDPFADPGNVALPDPGNNDVISAPADNSGGTSTPPMDNGDGSGC